MRKIFDPRNTHEQNFWTYEIPTKIIYGPGHTYKRKPETHDVPTKKNSGPTKYPRRHDGMMALSARSRPTKFSALF